MLVNLQIEITEEQIKLLKLINSFLDIYQADEVLKEFTYERILEISKVKLNEKLLVDIINHYNDHGQIDIWLSDFGKLLLNYI